MNIYTYELRHFANKQNACTRVTGYTFGMSTYGTTNQKLKKFVIFFSQVQKFRLHIINFSVDFHPLNIQTVAY